MSVNISVSNDNSLNYNNKFINNNCMEIIFKFLHSKQNIDCRVIDTVSIVDDEIQKGCLITLGKKYQDTFLLDRTWKIIKSDYECAHLKIDGIFDGCIDNYLNAKKCGPNRD